MSAVKTLFKVAHNSVIILRKYAPNILTALSVVSTVGAVGTSVKATWESKEIIETHNADIIDIREDLRAAKTPEEAKECKKQLLSKYADTVLDVLDEYLAPTILTGASIAAGITSNHISNRRIAALGASFTFIKNAFDKYRERVKNKYGEEEEKDIYYGAKEVEKEVVDEKGKKKKIKVKEYDPNDVMNNPCAILLGDGIKSDMPEDKDDGWNRYKLRWLCSKQEYLTHQLNRDGFIFMSDIAKELGVKPSSTAQLDIWSHWGIIKKEQNIQNLYAQQRAIAVQFKIPYEKPSDRDIEFANRVDLGIDNPINANFVNGTEPMFWVIPNLDGDITNKIFQSKTEREYLEAVGS